LLLTSGGTFFGLNNKRRFLAIELATMIISSGVGLNHVGERWIGGEACAGRCLAAAVRALEDHLLTGVAVQRASATKTMHTVSKTK
jgi:hypothetical protein